jgi:hypothetical protein
MIDNPDKHESNELVPQGSIILSEEEQAVLEQITGGNWKKYGRVAMAAMGGIPWVGSILGAAAALSGENEQAKTNKLLFLWLQEHEIKLRQLISDLQRIFARLESFGEEIKTRIDSPEYLDLVRKTFRVWDVADTTEKKDMLRKLITNAGGVSIVQDDIVRLFVELLGRFHELHFKIIREIYSQPGISSYDLGIALFGEIPRDNSAKADLFKFLMHDLNMTDIVRQARESDGLGRWKTRASVNRAPSLSGTLQTPFDQGKQQVLTELGKEFVHYVMEDLAPQIGPASQPIV